MFLGHSARLIWILQTQERKFNQDFTGCRHRLKLIPGNEAANCCDVVRGKCNKGGVEWLVLLLVVQDFGFTATKTNIYLLLTTGQILYPSTGIT